MYYWYIINHRDLPIRIRQKLTLCCCTWANCVISLSIILSSAMFFCKYFSKRLSKTRHYCKYHVHKVSIVRNGKDQIAHINFTYSLHICYSRINLLEYKNGSSQLALGRLLFKFTAPRFLRIKVKRLNRSILLQCHCCCLRSEHHHHHG